MIDGSGALADKQEGMMITPNLSKVARRGHYAR
jgi:hypothetical protein